ncbi:hypothetical protein D8S78_06635 [Natrialba swarupiae]|nr:hypothetical protein [Natrialba swarupiae]
MVDDRWLRSLRDGSVRNEVFEVGEELPRQEVYFTQIAPEVDGEFTHQYNAQNGDVTVDLDLEREIRAVDDDTEYWSTSEPLNESTATGVEPGDRVGSSFAIDVPALEEEIERTESSLGDSPGTTEAVVVAEVTMEGRSRANRFSIRIGTSS